MCMRVTGLKIRHTGMGSTLMLMGRSTKESGRKTNKMGTVLNHGLTRRVMRDITAEARNKVLVNSHGLMGRTMRVNS